MYFRCPTNTEMVMDPPDTSADSKAQGDSAMEHTSRRRLPDTFGINEMNWFFKSYSKEDYEADGPYAWLVGLSFEREGLFDQYASLCIRDAVQKGVPEEYIKRRIANIKEERICRRDGNLIRDQILAVAEDDSKRDKVSVLGYPPGAGKSTAVCYLIRDVIQRDDGHGLLIVTDSKERVNDYVRFSRDRDAALSEFLYSHRNDITVMLSENLQAAYAQQAHTPVLIMTTQRYFDMAPEDINALLTWDGGDRPLVIIDEEPPLTEAIGVDIKLFNDVDTALQKAVEDRTADKLWCREQWDRVRNRYKVVADSFEQLEGYKFDVYYKGESEQLTEDDERFFGFIARYRQALLKNEEKVLEYIRAAKQMMTGWAVCSCQKNSAATYRKEFYVYLDNRDKVLGIDAKVIILDGTADISPMYDEDFIDRPDCDEQLRSLNNLTIKIVDQPTNKSYFTGMNRQDRESKLNAIYESFIHEPDAGEHPVVFTYKGSIEEFFKSKLNKTPTDDYVNHFGNIKGSNHYKDASCLVQIGLNRFPPGYYLALDLGHRPEVREELNTLPYGETRNKLKELEARSEDTHLSYQEDKYVLPMLRSDIEQNMYRGLIRKPILTERMTFYLYIHNATNRELIQAIKDRYDDEYGFRKANVIEMSSPLMTEIEKIMRRQSSDNRPNSTQRFVLTLLGRTMNLGIPWENAMEPGVEFTREEFRNKAGISKDQLKELLESHAALKDFWDSCWVRRGVYCIPDI